MSANRLPAIFAGLIFTMLTVVCARAGGFPGPLRLDPSVPAQRELYAKLHVKERFGIVFHPYASVCPDDARHLPRCMAKVVTDESGVPLRFRSSAIGGYSPQQLRSAYGITGIANGTPIVAIVDAYGYPGARDDLSLYSQQFGLPELPKCKGPVAKSAVACFEA
ncbi:MAG TPA: hypothetical protein VHZ29_14935, partial [Rhizomicrobium sp.]|nr:hypothetical protein [Rhizomicrobium sp.]